MASSIVRVAPIGVVTAVDDAIVSILVGIVAGVDNVRLLDIVIR